ncbi:MAG: protease modulator HflC [Rhodospirillales bacterium]|nr:protease modulator HflC [Rhodospirillales bacterium]
MSKGLTALAIVAVILGIVGFSSVYTVHQVQQVLVLQFGEPVRVVREPGLKFKIPFIQDVTYIDNRILDLDAPPAEVIASDQKRLVVDAFARFKIVDPLLFYQTVGNEGVARSRMGSLINSNLRQVLGSEAFSTVLSGERDALMRRISDSVNAEAKDFGIVIVDVKIKRADLPQANSQAIYRRMQTERLREASEFRAQGAETAQRIRSRADREKTVLIADAQKQSEILRGEGDGKAVKIFADAFGKDSEFFAFYRSMQAYGLALGNDDTTLVLSPDSEFFRFFGDIDGKAGK